MQSFIHSRQQSIEGSNLSRDSHKDWLRKGLVYLGTSGGLLVYTAYVIAIRSNAPPFTYHPLEELLMFPALIGSGVATSILFGLGLYYIIKSASHSNAAQGPWESSPLAVLKSGDTLTPLRKRRLLEYDSSPQTEPLSATPYYHYRHDSWWQTVSPLYFPWLGWYCSQTPQEKPLKWFVEILIINRVLQKEKGGSTEKTGTGKVPW